MTDLLRPVLITIAILNLLWVVWAAAGSFGPVVRWRALRRLERQIDPRATPEERAEARAALRRAVESTKGGPRLTFPEGLDPAAPTVPIRVEPLGDGRPGEAFLAPGPAYPTDGQVEPSGGRTDVMVSLGRVRVLLVVCLGRVGAVTLGEVVAAAPDRPTISRALGGHGHHVGPVEGALQLVPAVDIRI